MHQCAFCQKTFPSASKLQRHHLIHTGQKPFTCLFCGKAFRQSVHLKKHTETHTGKNNSLISARDSSQHDSYTQYLLQSEMANYGESTQETYRQDFSNNITLSSPVFTAAAAQTEDARGRSTRDHGHMSSEIEYQHEHRPQVSQDNGISTDGQVSQDNGISTDGQVSQDNVISTHGQVSQDDVISTDGQFLSNPLCESTDSSAILDDPDFYAQSGHTCTTCMKSFSSSLQLQLHLPLHDPLTPFECGTCGRSFTSQTQILLHLESHENVALPENFPISTTRQKSPRELIRPTVNHQCPSCSKTFCSPSKLKRHFLTHTGQKPFSCVICEKTFRQATHLKTHLYAHRNLCSKNVSKAKHVRNDAHRIPSTLDDPVTTAVEMEVQCEISVSAPQSQNKKEIESQEIVKVEGEVKDSCSETFDNIVEHRQHDITHSDCKPFQCPVCKRAFRLSVHLKRHQVTHKNQNKSPLLEPMQGVSQSELRPHFNPDNRMISPDPSDVKALCLDIQVKPETWSQHPSDQDVLPLQEGDSPTLFDTPLVAVQSTSHPQGINRKSHQCLTCLKSFPSPSKLDRHMLSHTGQRPFTCQMCDKSFRQPTHLRVHSRTHLWSKYHKQRQTHINRPPSRSMHVNKSNATSPANYPFGGKLPKKSKSKMNSDLASMQQVSQASTLHLLMSKWKESQRKALSVPPPENVPGQSTRAVSKAAALDKSEAFEPVQSLPPKKHQCYFCLKEFPSASKLQRHNLVHTDLRPYLCLTCGKTFRQAPHLKVHERTHSRWKPIRQMTRQGLTSLTRERPRQPQYPKISICVPSKTIHVKTDTLHLSTDREADRISGTWGSQERRKNVPIKLNQLHHSKMRNSMTNGNNRAHSCVICQKSFPTPYKLSRHFLIHSGVKPYKCSICLKMFTQANHLKKHKLMHNVLNNAKGVELKEKDLQAKCVAECITPEITSSQPTDSVGEGQRKQAEQCDISSAHNSVTEEAFRHELETSQSQCVAVADIPAKVMGHDHKQRDNCGSAKSYRLSSFPSALTAEIQRQSLLQDIVGPTSLQEERNGSINDRQIAFEISGATDDADSYIKQGDVVENSLMAELPYWCEPVDLNHCYKCSMTFDSKGDLESHKCVTGSQTRVTQSSLYQCAVCFKEFVSPSKLKRHYVTHTGQRPFKCGVCDKTFTQSTHLKTHARCHRK